MYIKLHFLSDCQDCVISFKVLLLLLLLLFVSGLTGLRNIRVTKQTLLLHYSAKTFKIYSMY